MRFEIVNPGNTEAKFEFLFPADLRLELEGWADNAELSKSQFDILQVEDNKLFQVFFNLFFLLNNINWQVLSHFGKTEHLCKSSKKFEAENEG